VATSAREAAAVQMRGVSFRDGRSSSESPRSAKLAPARPGFGHSTPQPSTRRTRSRRAPLQRSRCRGTPPAERREAQEESAAHNGEIRNPRLQGRDDTTTVGAVCAATHPGANIAEIAGAGATWELPAPVNSLAALVSHTPTSIAPNEYRVAFEVQPDGAVPPFTQEVESPTREMERAKAKQVEAG
jgi:hypothetical protein